jgi:predicted nucleotidyltransferase
MMEPDREYYIRELSRETKTHYSMIYKEIENLEQLGVIKTEKKGRITLLRVNKELPYYHDLRSLIMKTTGISHTILNQLETQQNIEYLLIFGSAASGEDAPQSDIDLMIIGEPTEETLLESVNAIEKSTGKEINYILWTREEFEKKIKENNHIILDIADKPLIMLKGEVDAFRRTIKNRHTEESQAQ